MPPTTSPTTSQQRLHPTPPLPPPPPPSPPAPRTLTLIPSPPTPRDRPGRRPRRAFCVLFGLRVLPPRLPSSRGARGR
ncbi:hypothetical protein PVAP13_9KG446185 [Panicum virgatum]|uniref:Uncharacterized protein n=1 Tax=Panicum virgatum TaxID=38727 RepID=A0A8T0NPI2_PANVG|nr:hypothetical protein PVAP13_9KG446185 [Panicum virgatum]